MKVSVKTPATIANLGPGFDSFGLALPLYDIISSGTNGLLAKQVDLATVTNKYKAANMQIGETSMGKLFAKGTLKSILLQANISLEDFLKIEI